MASNYQNYPPDDCNVLPGSSQARSSTMPIHAATKTLDEYAIITDTRPNEIYFTMPLKKSRVYVERSTTGVYDEWDGEFDAIEPVSDDGTIMDEVTNRNKKACIFTSRVAKILILILIMIGSIITVTVVLSTQHNAKNHGR